MIPRAMPDMYMRAYPLLCRAILGVLYMCLFFWPSLTYTKHFPLRLAQIPSTQLLSKSPKHMGRHHVVVHPLDDTISRDSTLLRLWDEVFWGARFIPAIGTLLASKHRGQVILFREDF